MTQTTRGSVDGYRRPSIPINRFPLFPSLTTKKKKRRRRKKKNSSEAEVARPTAEGKLKVTVGSFNNSLCQAEVSFAFPVASPNAVIAQLSHLSLLYIQPPGVGVNAAHATLTHYWPKNKVCSLLFPYS